MPRKVPEPIDQDHSGSGDGISISEAAYRRWEMYRAVAIGHRMTLKGEPRVIYARDFLDLRCAFNHQIAMSGKELLRGTGCSECNRVELEAFRHRQLEDAKELAERRGGVCLSDDYGNAHQRLAWRCHLGHEWNASIANVRSKLSWCPSCARAKPRPGRRKGASRPSDSQAPSQSKR